MQTLLHLLFLFLIFAHFLAMTVTPIELLSYKNVTALQTENCRHIFWLHTPKTSSTLCTTINHICCPEKFSSSMGKFSSSRYNETLLAFSQSAGDSDSHPFPHDKAWGCVLPLKYSKSAGSCSLRLTGRQHIPFPTWVDYNGLPTKAQRRKAEYLKHGKLIAVTMIRRPFDRILSAFMDSLHSEGFSEDERIELQKRMQNFSDQTSLPDQLEKAKIYLGHPNAVGCYTKMLNGHECYSSFITRDTAFNETALNVAKSLLNQFYFVGILEQYEKSIHLFHKMANAGTFPHPAEIIPTRQQKDHNKTKYLRNNLQFSDPYDDPLYIEATKIFHKALDFFNI